jgi:hypothetical protein
MEDPILLVYGNSTASLGNLILSCSGNMVSLYSGDEMSKMIVARRMGSSSTLLWKPHNSYYKRPDGVHGTVILKMP